MLWKPQPDMEVPVYKQIYYYFEEQIIKGELSPGTKLPAERELAVRFSVNRSTVTAAYEELRAAGLASSVQGSGTRVSELMWDKALHKAPDWQRYTAGFPFNPVSAIYKRLHEASAGPDVIDLTKGELSPDLMPLELLRDAAVEIDFDQPYSYHHDFRGELGLRQTLSRFLYEKMNITSDPKHIVITAGVKHSLYLIANTLLQPGDAVAVEGPSYLYAMKIFTEAGLRMVKLPIDEDGLVPDLLPELFHRNRVRMIFTSPTFQNPTGTSLSVNRRKRLLELCEQLRLPIVEDDPYGLLRLDPAKEPLPSLKAMNGGERLVIYLGTLSKIATPGMRFGWIVAPGPIASKLAGAKNRMGFSTGHIGERLAERYILSPESDKHLRSVCDRLLGRRECMIKALDEVTVREHIVPLVPTSPAGGFYIWLRLKLKRPPSDRELVEAGIRQRVLIYPGGVFGAERGYVRLTYASVDEDQITEGVRRFGKVLERLSAGE